MSKKASQASIQAIAVLDELKIGITDLVEHHKDTQIPLNETASVARVCFTVEKILHIGLKDIAIFGTTTVWDYLIEVKECLPGGEKLVEHIKDIQKTDIGRARAFIRIGLNEQSLGSFLEALVWNRELTTKYYSKDSLLAVEEYASMIFLLLESIKNVPFKLRVDDTLLGHLHYWDLMARSAVSPVPMKKGPIAHPHGVSHPTSNQSPHQTNQSTQHALPHSPQQPPRVIQPAPISPASTGPVAPYSIPVSPPAPVNIPGNPFDEPSPAPLSIESSRPTNPSSSNAFGDGTPSSAIANSSATPISAPIVHNSITVSKEPPSSTQEPVELIHKAPMPSSLVTRPNGLGPGYATAPTPENSSAASSQKLEDLPDPSEDLSPDSPLVESILDRSDDAELTPRIADYSADSKTSTDAEISPAVSRVPSLSESPFTALAAERPRISVGQSPAPYSSAAALLSSADWAEVGRGVETLLQQTVQSLNDAQSQGLIDLAPSMPTVAPIQRSDPLSASDRRTRTEELRDPTSITPLVSSVNASSSPKIDEIERSLLRAPFASEFDEDSRVLLQTPPNYGRVLYTPPGSGRVPRGVSPAPLTPTAVRGPSANVFSSGDILGTTPSQADLPSLVDSLKQQNDVSIHHKQMLLTLKDSISSLNGTGEIIMRSPAAIEILDGVESILLDCFLHVESWDVKYASLWSWLSNAPPSLPHITQILYPLTQALQQTRPSAVALCRAFVGAAINRKCLDNILSSLVRDSSRPSSPVRIDQRSLLASESLSTLFFKLIQELKEYNFDLSESPAEIKFAGATAAVSVSETSAASSIPQSSSVASTASATASSASMPSGDRPPSFKKKKKLVTIQDAPTTPQSKQQQPPKPSVDSSSYPRFDGPLDASPPASMTLPAEPSVSSSFSSSHQARHTIDSSSPSGSPLHSNIPLGGGWREVQTFTDPPRRTSPMGSFETESSLGRTAFGAKDSLTKSPKGSSSMKLFPSSPSDSPVIRPSAALPPSSNVSFGQISGYTELRSQMHDSYVNKISSSPMAPFDFSTDTRTAPAAYASSSSSSARTSSSPGGHQKRTRSFSGGAPEWALAIQQFPAGSYKPDTEWLGGTIDGDEFDDWDRSITSSPTMIMGTSPTMASSSSPTFLSSSPSLPHRLLKADVIAEYKPASKKSVIRRTGFPSASANEKDVMKVKQPDGEEALEVDSQLYKNSKPAEFFVLEVVTKSELTSKNSLCSGCGEDLTIANARWCAYSGNYYCPKCHSGKSSILPARVIKQWNFKIAKVSDWAYDYLRENWNRPVLDVAGLLAVASTSERTRSLGLGPLPISLPIPLSLPRLPLTGKKSAPVSVIIHLSSLRERLVSVAEFIRSCRNGQRQLANLTDRLHLLWSSTLWSMQDLVDARTGKLEPILERSLQAYSSHVRGCDTCSGKGFVCEICSSREVIYPFDTKTASCPHCKALFHESCWRNNPGKCPKCVRVKSIRKPNVV